MLVSTCYFELRIWVYVPQDARGDVATAADGDHEVGFEVIEDLVGGSLAQLVHLSITSVSLFAPPRIVRSQNLESHTERPMHVCVVLELRPLDLWIHTAPDISCPAA